MELNFSSLLGRSFLRRWCPPKQDPRTPCNKFQKLRGKTVVLLMRILPLELGNGPSSSSFFFVSIVYLSCFNPYLLFFLYSSKRVLSVLHKGMPVAKFFMLQVMYSWSIKCNIKWLNHLLKHILLLPVVTFVCSRELGVIGFLEYM